MYAVFYKVVINCWSKVNNRQLSLSANQFDWNRLSWVILLIPLVQILAELAMGKTVAHFTQAVLRIKRKSLDWCR
jgi:di/tricarboxylate transporter